MDRHATGSILPFRMILSVGCAGLFALAAVSWGLASRQDGGMGQGPAVDAALDYLSTEVPAWESENGCFSCHNNGDAARALYVASRAGYDISDTSLATTNRWLAQPSGWTTQAGEPGVRDLRLAQIQFSAALQAGVEAGLIAADGGPAAAEALLRFQRADGSWAADSEATVGSPATYGAVLATATALRILRNSDVAGSAEALTQAGLWLENRPAVATVDIAARLIGLQQFREAVSRLPGDVERLLAGQGSDGGWGAYPKSAPEPFDTAIAMIALLGESSTRDTGKAIDAGIAFLVRSQLPRGGWVETTRPAGGVSYAQHMSTTAWATLALIKARSRRGD